MHLYGLVFTSASITMISFSRVYAHAHARAQSTKMSAYFHATATALFDAISERAATLHASRVAAYYAIYRNRYFITHTAAQAMLDDIAFNDIEHAHAMPRARSMNDFSASSARQRHDKGDCCTTSGTTPFWAIFMICFTTGKAADERFTPF